jgi:ABC-type antimicrobial peptide transport system permease subunit
VKITAIPLSYSIRNILTRRLTTILTTGGIALVIFVFAAVLMLAFGLEKTLIATGSENNAIIIRQGAQSESMSMIDRSAVNVIKNLQGVAQDLQGIPLAIPEAVVLISIPKQGTDKTSLVPCRGVYPGSLSLRPQIKLVAGRLWQPGSYEVIVGSAVSKRFQGVGLGGKIRFAMRDWSVVGLFDSGGSGFESEIWLDADQLLQAFRRTVYSSITLRLSSPSVISQIKERISEDPRLNVIIKPEKEYYSEQSRMLATFIRVLGIFITLIFSIGAMIGAMITMYAAVANRTREIGTLRAIGFQRRSILLVFLIESLLLSMLGGIAGLIIASFLQMITVSTMNFSTFSELAFSFSLSPAIILESMAFALLMGFLGGFLPALRASRQNIIEAIRAV